MMMMKNRIKSMQTVCDLPKLILAYLKTFYFVCCVFFLLIFLFYFTLYTVCCSVSLHGFVLSFFRFCVFVSIMKSKKEHTNTHTHNIETTFNVRATII